MTHSVHKTLLAVLAISATPALACPTVANLAKGIEVRTADGSVELHRQSRPDWVTLQVSYPQDDGSVMELYKGLYLHSVIPIVDGLPQLGQRENYASSEDLRQWDDPKPSASWQNTTAGGGQAQSGAEKSVSLGGCSYPSISIDITYNDDASYTETYDYLLPLGIALLVKTEDDRGTDTFEYVSIKAIE